MTDRDNWIEAGVVLRPHGLRGEIVADVKSDLTDVLTDGAAVRVAARSGESSRLTVEQARVQKGLLVVKFGGVDSRDDAEAMRGNTLWITRAQVGELPEGRYFVQDIVGLAVYRDSGECLGTVEDVLCMPASDVYVVRGDGGELLLPVIDDVILSVDIDGGKITVHLLDGLRQGAE